jgi:hypothetical protein
MDGKFDIALAAIAVGVARRSRAGTHRNELVRFIRPYVRVTDWLRNPGNHDEALMVFERVTKATPDAAQTAYRLLLTTDDGIQPNGMIDIAGRATVLKLRSEYGQPRRTLADPAKYVDERYYRATIAR